MKQALRLFALATFALGNAAAEPPLDPSPPAGAEAAERTEVLLGFAGDAARELGATLARLLEAELHANGLTLVASESSLDARRFADEAVERPRALLAVLLDTRAANGWRLIVIDTARRRAIARDLSGGIEENAASIEAIVSIVLSAVSALGEGLEVASSPLGAVVGPAPKPVERPVAPARRPAKPAPSTAPTFLRGSVGAAVAAFSSDVAPEPGLAVALGVTWRSALELRVSGARFVPASVDSAAGDFRIDRSVLALSAGPAFSRAPFVVTPEAGVVGEWLRRSDSAPAPGVIATDDEMTHRVGALLALRARLRLTAPLSLELVAGASYFGRAVHYETASPGARRLAEVWPTLLFAELGLDISTE